MMWLGLALDPYVTFKGTELLGDYCAVSSSGNKIEYRYVDYRWNAFLIGV